MAGVILNLDLGPDLLREFLNRPDGIRQWNGWVRAVAPLVTQSSGELSESVVLAFDFSNSNLIGMNLDTVDLSLAWLADTDFSSSSLRGAKVGCPVRACFTGADLTDATICGDVTGTDCRGALLCGTRMDCCGYEKGSPPLGLPAELLRLCYEEDVVEPKEAPTRLHTASVDVRARALFPLPSTPSEMATS
jgi:uncharacterized protein YjbI with pentapeptide repeats